MTLDPKFNGAVFNYKTQAMYFNKMNRHNFSLTYRICKEIFINTRMVVYFQKDFYLQNEFNKKITACAENGLTNQWRIKYLDFDIIKAAPTEGPKPLSLRQLYGSFKILIGGFIASVCVFGLERLSIRCEKLRKAFIG
jgi:CTP:phosphocholine cytidylyltransferase-like protein